MRRIFLAIIFVAFAVTGTSQVAPEVERGMAQDAVIRTYGWPKGKSATEGREIWVYDRFQVLFEDGKVVSVTHLAPAKAQITPPVRVTPKPNPTPKAPTSSSPLPSASRVIPLPSADSAQPNVRERTPTPSRAAPVPNAPTRRSTGSSQPPAARDDAPMPSRGAVRPSILSMMLPAIWPLLAFVALGLGIRFAVSHHLRRRVKQTASAGSQRDSLAQPNSQRGRGWKDEIGERLQKYQRNQIPPLVAAIPSRGATVLTMDLLGRLEWKRFELLVSRYFAAVGFRSECTRVGADGGVDAYLYRAGEARPTGFVQCKAWQSYKVGIKPVRELFGVMAAEGIAEGFFVTTSTFTQEARSSAVGKKLTLIDGDDFIARFSVLPEGARVAILAEVTAGDYITPTCPRCDVKLVLRANDSDQSSFWGCTRYPKCRYTLNTRGASGN